MTDTQRLRELDALKARVERLESALIFYADATNYIDHPCAVDLSQEIKRRPAKIAADAGRRAKAALGDNRVVLKGQSNEPEYT